MTLANYTQQAQIILLSSQDLAKEKKHSKIEPEHLTLCLIKTDEIRDLIDKKQVDFNSLLAQISSLIEELPKSTNNEEPMFSSRFMQLLSSTQAYCLLKQNKQVKPSDLFLCLLSNREKFGALGGVLARFFLSKPENKASGIKTPAFGAHQEALAKYCENINFATREKKIDPVFGRTNEVLRLIQVLSRKNRHHPLLIGEAGVGRTSIVYALTQKIIEEKVPSYLMTKELISLDVSLLLSGTTLRGQFEERMSQVFVELTKEVGKYILFIRDLAMLMGSGGQGASDAANMLKNQMQKGNVQIIALATPETYKKQIENDPSLERLFQPIWIEAPLKDECLTILKGIKPKLEDYHGVFIDDDAIEAAYFLCARHLSDKVLPQIAIDVLDEACAKHRMAMDEKPDFSLCKNKVLLEKKSIQYKDELELIESIRALRKEFYLSKSTHVEKSLREQERKFFKIPAKKLLVNPFVKRQDIAEVISIQTNIPAQKMVQSEREKLANMALELSSKVIGQKQAVESVSLAIQRSRVGIKYGKKPIGSFLFLGPTGVGKTELAKNLTTFLFDDEKAMIRFDMSEFMEKQSVARLIGAPPGYQGYEEGGELTQKVRRHPYSVILFDEIEKAHPDVLNILLQVLDEARLTDSHGVTVDFTNTVLIMTSNIGAQVLLTNKKVDLKEQMLHELKKYLRPEFINRIDEIVYFNPLSKENITDIAKLMIKNLSSLLKAEGYILEVDDKLFAQIIDEGFDADFGARPLKRALTKMLENPLAKALLNQELKAGKILATLNKNQETVFLLIK